MSSKIAVVGTGYVGLTTGSCLAHLGHRVTCIDNNPAKIAMIESGVMPISEDGLTEIVAEGRGSGRLQFTSDTAQGVTGAEFVLLCVPTPQAEDGSADLRYIEIAAREISPHLAPDAVIINKSTVPVGSTQVVADALGRDDVHVVSNPEFLREGHAVSDFLNPERVVVGAEDEAVAFRVAALHLRLSAPLLVTDPASAELIKYASNAFLALKISYVNAIAAVAEAVDADIDDVVKGLGLDGRIGAKFLQPGPGWGGSCLPKDTSALIRIAEDANYDFSLLKDVVNVNREQFERVVTKTEEVLGAPVGGHRIAVWGLTFKAHTDDLRDSPAIEIVRRLLAAGASVCAFDPEVEKGADVVEGLEVADTAYAACEGADALVVLTEWPEFGRTDLDRVADALVAPRIVDTRNVVDRTALERRGFTYRGIGRH
ncbi:MAG: UDP-glucose dehydrogenase family protein [Microthrixaceae bacterium]